MTKISTHLEYNPRTAVFPTVTISLHDVGAQIDRWYAKSWSLYLYHLLYSGDIMPHKGGVKWLNPPPSDGYLRWSRFKKSAWWESSVFRNNDELTRMVHLGYQHVLLSFPNIKVLAIQVYVRNIKISAYSLIRGEGGGSLYSHFVSPITGHHDSGTNLDRQN